MSDDFILEIKELIPKNECDKVIEKFESCGRKQEGRIGELGRVDHKIKKSTDAFFIFKKDDDLGISVINEYLPIGIKKYTERHPFITTIASWDIDYYYKIQRYYPNEGFFELHCENTSCKSKRMLAWMIYLNDVTDDGYTEFPSQGKKYQPRAGTMLIWPAFYTHPHKGVASKTQTKYIATGWCDYSDHVTKSKIVPKMNYE
tara:strand:- start:226 stop:831 length:606 start_codon:yes stop_codon:yes gene_type:complete